MLPPCRRERKTYCVVSVVAAIVCLVLVWKARKLRAVTARCMLWRKKCKPCSSYAMHGLLGAVR